MYNHFTSRRARLMGFSNTYWGQYCLCIVTSRVFNTSMTKPTVINSNFSWMTMKLALIMWGIFDYMFNCIYMYDMVFFHSTWLLRFWNRWYSWLAYDCTDYTLWEYLNYIVYRYTHKMTCWCVWCFDDAWGQIYLKIVCDIMSRKA